LCISSQAPVGRRNTARRAAAARKRAGLAFVLWSSHAILFHQYCLKAWGFLSVNSLAALQTLVTNLRKEAEQCPSTSTAIGQK
jgi:hypothetical protein